MSTLPKICMECRHHVPALDSATGYQLHLCKRPQPPFPHLVTGFLVSWQSGSMITCDYERNLTSTAGGCGLEGKFWESNTA